MNREVHVRFRERLRGKVPRATRPLTPKEWQQLVDAKAPLIHFRGQWMELDRENMQDMLAFMQQQNDATPELSVQELLKKLAEEADSFELDMHDSLAKMLANYPIIANWN